MMFLPESNTCTDVDECLEGTSGCSQECTNTVGSFTCSCFDGYLLDEDGKTCKGKRVDSFQFVKVYITKQTTWSTLLYIPQQMLSHFKPVYSI